MRRGLARIYWPGVWELFFRVLPFCFSFGKTAKGLAAGHSLEVR